MRDEFALIQQYFKRQTRNPQIHLGIGDDCALIKADSSHLLAISTDTLVAGVHFPESTSAFDIGYKALAVNLSDLAAMAALPGWFSLSLSLPQADESWLQGFSAGLFQLAQQYGLELIGGDTVRSSQLAVTITIHGYCDPQYTLYRHGATVGDAVFVSGNLGEACAGLHCVRQGIDNDYLTSRLNRPEPAIILAQKIKPFASACIDISDGLAADLGHILSASDCGAELELDTLIQNPNLQQVFSPSQAAEAILYGGDDYQLCFCVPRQKLAAFQRQVWQNYPQIHKIGEIIAQQQLFLKSASGRRTLATKGYNHFE